MALWTPADATTAPNVWIDATDNAAITAVSGKVSSYVNKGSNSLTLSQSTAAKRPVINSSGLNGLQTFTGSSANATTMSGTNTGGIGASGTATIFVVGRHSNTGDMDWFWSSNVEAGQREYYPNGYFPSIYGGSGSQFATNTPNPNYPSTTQVVAWEINASGASAWVRGNTTPVTSTATTLTGPGTSFWFMSWLDINKYVDGEFGELIIIDGALSTAQRQFYEGYLAWKWGDQANLASGHPYASAAPTNGITLTGQLGTVSRGTVAPAVSVALTGLGITAARGSVTAGADVTLALTGLAGTVAGGSLASSRSKALTGSALTATRGTVVGTRTKALTGQALASSIGTISETLTVALSGAGIAAAAGNVSAGADVTLALTGQALSLAIGVVGDSTSVGLAGQSVSVSRGNVTAGADVTAAIVGQSVFAARGSLLGSTSVGLTGNAVGVARGSVTAGADVTVALSGQFIGLARGSLSPGLSASLSGQVLIASLGPLASFAAVGLTGQSSTASAGALVPARAASILGQSVAANVGTLTLTATVGLSGQVLTVSAANLTRQIDSLITPAIRTARLGATNRIAHLIARRRGS